MWVKPVELIGGVLNTTLKKLVISGVSICMYSDFVSSWMKWYAVIFNSGTCLISLQQNPLILSSSFIGIGNLLAPRSIFLE